AFTRLRASRPFEFELRIIAAVTSTPITSQINTIPIIFKSSLATTSSTNENTFNLPRPHFNCSYSQFNSQTRQTLRATPRAHIAPLAPLNHTKLRPLEAPYPLSKTYNHAG